MIRNVVLVRLRPGEWGAQVAELQRSLAALPCPGMTGFSMGGDAGLREGNMDLAIVSDFVDEHAYREYDADPEHNRLRRELLGPIAEHVERCQFSL